MKHFIVPVTALFLAACFPADNKTESPAGYNFSKPEKIILPDVLQEISGISVKNGGTFYAVQDEKGILFETDRKGEIISESRFAGNGDYEDLVVAGEHIVILRSDGGLYSLAYLSDGKIENVNMSEGLLPKGEYEGLAYDGRFLYVLCKDCPQDEKNTPGYILEVSGEGRLQLKEDFKISTAEIKAKTSKKGHFRPSALTFNTVTNEWFIISSVSKLLVITDPEWKVKEVFRLDPDIFPQPEGISFDQQNNLYITNEGDKTSQGNVLKFIFSK